MLETIVLRIGIVSLTCSAVLLPLLLFIRWLHNRYAARTCYFLWLLLALRLVLPFQITLPTPAVTVEAPSPTITIPSTWNTVTHTVPNVPQTQPSPPFTDAPANPSATLETPTAPVRTVSLMAILGVVWLAGMAAYGGSYLLTYAAVRRRLLSRVRPVGEEEIKLFQHLAQEVGCHRTARLYWSEDIHSPMMLGLVRPAVLLPAHPIGEEELTIILRHELTHLKRGDVAYKLLLLAANGVHWFNPLVWWMAREAAHNLELCCDDDVVCHQSAEFRRLYGEILLQTAQESGSMPALSTRFGSGKAQMEGRLMNLFQKKRNSALLVCATFTTTFLLGSLVGCESGNHGLPGNRSDPASSVSGQESETFDTKLYINYQEAYQDVIAEMQKKQNEFTDFWYIERGCLYDIDGNGQDELLYVYLGGSDTLYCAVWTFDSGKPILLFDGELASLAGAGTGGFNLVEYEGTQYICGWASNSEPWPPDANMYYDCFLWEYPTAFEFPRKFPDHTFAFRYFWLENGDIDPDAFSLVQDGRIALPIEKLQELKDILLDNPIQTLCEANIYNGKGLSFDEMLSSLQATSIDVSIGSAENMSSPGNGSAQDQTAGLNEPLTVEQAAEILKEQLTLAYENTYGEYLPVEEKPDGVVEDSEYLAWAIPHLELSGEDDQYYIFDVIFPFLIDKKTGEVFKHYNGLDPFTIPFDPTDTNALAFAG